MGVERVSGERIAFLDDDDLWLATKLGRQVVERDANAARLRGRGAP